MPVVGEGKGVDDCVVVDDGGGEEDGGEEVKWVIEFAGEDQVEDKAEASA